MTDFGRLVEDGRVHRDMFVRPDVYDEEMVRIFSTVWVYVAHESEIPNAGDFKLTQLGIEPVIVTRAASGAVNVLLNRCAHRGLTVCQKRTGNATSFRCAYHSWTYDGDGKLIGVPYPKGYGDDFDREAYSLGGPPRVESYRGFVFASFNPDVIRFSSRRPSARSKRARARTAITSRATGSCNSMARSTDITRTCCTNRSSTRKTHTRESAATSTIAKTRSPRASTSATAMRRWIRVKNSDAAASSTNAYAWRPAVRP
jgi:nitrite reductase/ring-hydroxylating ferredoxin subunit